MTSTISCNPFPGLRPFRTDEDYLFFGREGQSEEILRRLRQNRFLSVVGTSGSGKSSLIRAGLLPYLFGGFMSGAGSHWRVALFRPGSDPIGNLARALNDPAVIGKTGEDEEAAKRSALLLEVTLRRGGLGLIEAARSSSLAERENLLIVVDQFEELFRFAGAASSQNKEEDAAALVKLLLEATAQSALPIYVVITMRSDFIGDCARFRDLPEAMTAGLYLIPRMTREQRRAAIEGPAQVGSAVISRRLINRLLNDGGDDPDQLPSLQHALMRTWVYWEEHHQDGQPIDIDDYLAVGGIAQALSRHAEEAFAELPDERSRQIAKRLFQSLTEKGADNREIRRPTKLVDIAAMADARIAEVVAVIEYFRREGRSFLTPPADVPLNGESVIDISHESLIRGWDRLRTWVEEEYESAKMYRRLAETAALYGAGKAALWQDPDLSNALRWKAVEKPTAAWAKAYNPGFDAAMAFLEESLRARDQAAAEREGNRRKRLRNARVFAATVTALFLLAAAAATYAFIEQGRAVENARQAQKQRDAAREATTRAEASQTTAEANQQMAVRNQNMALDFASSTVRGLSDLNEFVLSQREVQDHLESLLNEAGNVHGNVLQRDPNNFQAKVMRVNAQTALAKLHVVSGRLDAARAECAKQDAEAAELEKVNTDNAGRLVIAYLLSRVASTWKQLNERTHALADERHAVGIADGVRSDMSNKHTPWGQQSLRCVGIVYSTSGYVEDQFGDPKLALNNYQKAVNILTLPEDEALAGNNKQHVDERLRQSLLDDLRALAALQAKADQKPAAAATFARAIQLAQSWGKNDANVTDSLFWLYTDRGDSKRDAKQYPEALQDYQAAAKLAKTLNPDTTDAQYDSANVEDLLGTLDHYWSDAEKTPARKQQLLQSARDRHIVALDKFQKMGKARGKNPGLEHAIGVAEHNLAWDLEALQKPAEVRLHRERSLAAYKLAAEVNPIDTYLSSTAMAYRSLALLDQQEKKWDGVIDDYSNAIDFDKRLVNWDESAKHILLSDFAKLADAKQEKNDYDGVVNTYKEGIETGEHWTEDATPGPVLVKDVLALYLGRGDIWSFKKAYDKAHSDYAAAGRQAGHLNSSSVDGKFARSQVSEHIGNALKNQAKAEENTTAQHDLFVREKASYEDTLQLRRQILAAGVNAEAQHNLAIAEANLAYALYSLKDWDGARRLYTASADAYAEASRLRPSEEERDNLEQAYYHISALDVDRGGDRLTNGTDAEAQEAFKSARAAAARPGWASNDGRAVRSEIEQYIAGYWREKGKSSKDQSHKEEYFRQALEAHETALKLLREIASGKKDPEAEQSVGKAEKDVGLDYAYLKDEENAKRHIEASSKTYLTSKPGRETTRIVARTYSEFANLESELGNQRAAHDAHDKEIELLQPLIESLAASEDDKRLLAGAFGGRSWENTLLGDPWNALSDADQGLVLDSQLDFIRLNKADAYLLLGQFDKAREIYLSFADEAKCKWCRDSILEDLAELQAHPELKVDPHLLTSLQEELKRGKPPQKTTSQEHQ